MRVAPEIKLKSEEREALERLAHSGQTPERVIQRARIVLLAARGMQNKDIAVELDVGRVQVARWRERFRQSGIAAIERDSGEPAPAQYSAADPDADAADAANTGGPQQRAMAPRSRRAALTSPETLRTASPPPPLPDAARRQLMHGFEFARNARLVQRLEDIVGLYITTPTCALVLCCDEGDDPGQDAAQPAGKSRGAAQQARTWSEDELRHGAGNLFAALAMLENMLGASARRMPQRTELLAFLRQVDSETPKGKTLHVIADSDSTDIAPATARWLAAHPRVQMHFAPASVSWISSVMWFFSHIDDSLLRRSAFASVPLLIAAIEHHVAHAGIEGPLFTWTRHSTLLDEGQPRTAGASRSPAKTAAGADRRGDSLRDYVTTLKRERILQEAARLFFEQGYLQTSVDAIAERLGATKPFVYYHFSSKVDILVEICERSNRAALAAADNAMSSRGSPRVRFEQFLREFTDVVLRDHQMVAIYFREQINLPADSAARINQMRKSIDERLTALLIEGIESGEFQIEDPRIGTLVIAGMSSYAFAWYRDDGRLDQQEVTDRIVRMALKLVSAAPYFTAAAYHLPGRVG